MIKHTILSIAVIVMAMGASGQTKEDTLHVKIKVGEGIGASVNEHNAKFSDTNVAKKKVPKFILLGSYIAIIVGPTVIGKYPYIEHAFSYSKNYPGERKKLRIVIDSKAETYIDHKGKWHIKDTIRTLDALIKLLKIKP